MMAYVKMMDLGFEEFSKAIHYDPETGVMTWKVAPNRRYKAGDVVGGEEWEGAVGVGIGHLLAEHRRRLLALLGADQ